MNGDGPEGRCGPQEWAPATVVVLQMPLKLVTESRQDAFSVVFIKTPSRPRGSQVWANLLMSGSGEALFNNLSGGEREREEKNEL